jgi:hypothetical protein
MYEKHVGIFCIGCEPTDSEDIRSFKQAKANAKADKYDAWAEKRRERANKVLDHNHEHYTSCHAFNTQPGHIPIRARIIKQQDKAYESLRVAKEMQRKAQVLRHVRVKGDADKKRQEQRELCRSRLTVGMEVDTSHYGRGIVKKINKKSASVEINGSFTTTIDLSFICPWVRGA